MLALGCAEPPSGAPSPTPKRTPPAVAPSPEPPAAKTHLPTFSWRDAHEPVRSPVAQAADPQLLATRAALERVVQEHARDPSEPVGGQSRYLGAGV